MNYLALLLALTGIVLGGAGIVLAGMDDSPGGQILGVAFVLGAVAFGLRSVRRAPR